MSKQLTGYASVDKPWLKYYSDEAINMPLPEGTMCSFVEKNNPNNLNGIAFRYFGTKISYNDIQIHIHEYHDICALAFNPDVNKAFMGSIRLAKESHVPEEQILKTIEDIDNYFTM